MARTKSPQTKKKIIQVALQLLLKKDYSAITVSEIAKEAGLAEGTLYGHFTSKDGIFVEIFSSYWDSFMQGLQPVLWDEAPMKARIERLVNAFYAFYDQHFEAFMFLFFRGRDFRGKILVKETPETIIERIILIGVATGEIVRGNKCENASILASIMIGAIINPVSGPDRLTTLGVKVLSSQVIAACLRIFEVQNK